MNERTYLKRMISLKKELERTHNAEPYDPDAYNKIVDDMSETRAQYDRSIKRMRRILCVVWILLGLLLIWLVIFERY